MSEIHKPQFDQARFDLLSLVVLTICQVKYFRKVHRWNKSASTSNRCCPHSYSLTFGYYQYDIFWRLKNPLATKPKELVAPF